MYFKKTCGLVLLLFFCLKGINVSAQKETLRAPGAYCIPVSTGTLDYIKSFTTTGGTTNASYNSTALNPTGYGDFFDTNEIITATASTLNFTETYYSSSHGFAIWIDYNKDGDFADTGEAEFASAATASGHSGSFVINTVAAGEYRMRIRANSSSNTVDPCANVMWGEAIDFKVTILDNLPCSGLVNPITVSAITHNTATISWTGISPAPANGYQISVSTIPGVPTSSGTHTTTSTVTTLNVSSLTPKTTYYVYVRANCGATGEGNWIGASFKTTCIYGSGTGTSSMGCPNVVAGGLGLNGADHLPLNSCGPATCLDLEAKYLKLGNTSSYSVQSIPYAPPYQFGCLRNKIAVNVDDYWSPEINLPFNFCFYGNTYNKCVVSSNGVLTFDLSRANTYAGYAFSNNLPSTLSGLFANSIYGVYHDIDPKDLGEVGWELITLDSGCRALVVSWNEVPMFSTSCRSKLSSAMMVLYENTNIIEVYIKEKNICSTWNDGNSIVGIQNVGATTATVAPGRNALSPDWQATNEAWRFVPSGGSITSIKWYQGPGTTGPVVGTTDVINVCPSTTTTYTAEVTYALDCGLGTIKVTDQTTVSFDKKTWTGATSTEWNTASNWTPSGVPTNATQVIIPNTVNKPIISSSNMMACNLTVQNGGSLTIAPTASLVVTNYVNVDAGGNFLVRNDGSLIQINNVTNTVNGTFTYERTANNIKGSDYIYWSSPVANQDMSTIYTSPSQGPKYHWNTTVANPRGGLGNWNAASGIMTPAKGYIIRGSNAFGMSATAINTTFTGTPNNGNITIPATRGNMLTTNVGPSLTYSNSGLNAWDDNWNLVGNPYPSAINALQFLSDNSTELMGTVRLWRHLNTPAPIPSPFYQDFTYNYNSSDYFTLNFTGPTTPGASEIIKTGQAFMVQRKEGEQDLTGINVIFNNTMRRDGTTILGNDNFFRAANSYSNNVPERHRVWVDIVDDTNLSSETTLLGYVEGATTGWDDNFDATIGITGDIGIYSFANTEKCIIQGRPAPFSIYDEVPMGINVHTNGSYHIAIKAVDGLFLDNNQKVYLEDKQQNIIHDLTANPYRFTSRPGTFNDRFVLRYREPALNNTNFELENSVRVFATNHIKVNSTIEKIKDIVVYDVIGKKLIDKKDVDLNEIQIQELNPTTNVLLVKVTLESGAIITKKVLY
ncbi:MAG: GEVED domain-containing protein [Limnohabitans sp.]|nr:GEVED domain-containing protein [Limnohabitans sp.]